jgi:WD40 repeat protein
MRLVVNLLFNRLQRILPIRGMLFRERVQVMNSHSNADCLQAYLDGELPPDEVAALQARLKAEPHLAEQLLALAQNETVLRDWARNQPIPIALGSPTAPAPTRRPSPWRVRWTAAALVAATIAVVLFALWKPLLRKPSRKPADLPETAQPLASLSGLQGEVSLGSNSGSMEAAQDGDDIFAGQEIHTGEGSQAVVKYPDGTELVLTPDTRLRIEDEDRETPDVGKRLFLAAGLVEADVAKQPDGKPMVLRTPHAAIRVLGTRFRSTASSEATRVELEEGRVQMTRLSDGKSILVEKDRFAVASHPPQPLVTQPLPPRVTRGQLILADQQEQVTGLCFSPDGLTLAVARSDGTVALWDRATGNIRQVIQAHSRKVKTLAFSPDGNILATGGADKAIKFWDTATGEPHHLVFPVQRVEIDALAFAPDGAMLASALAHGKGGKGSEQIVLWDALTGKEMGRLPGHAKLISSLAFSMDGATLATVGRDGALKLWDVAQRTERAAFRDHIGEIFSLAFSPDGKWLATGGKDRVIRLRTAATGEPCGKLDVHGSEVVALAFSPDSQFLACSGSDRLVHLWDVAAGVELREFGGHKKGPIPGLTISSDGKLLATAGRDRRVMLWNLSGESQKAEGRKQ